MAGNGQQPSDDEDTRGAYHIFMVDLMGAFPRGLGWAVKSRLNLLMDPVIGYDNFFNLALVSYNGPVTPMPYELLVYFHAARGEHH